MLTRIVVLIVFSLATLLSPSAGAADRIGFIRDAEVENALRAYATPLFQAVGLPPEAIRIHLVKDSSLNAFVAGGLRLFINTGLLMRSENASQLIGVIAHETGHISGGHLARLDEALANATAESIVAMVLGAAAAAAGGGAAGAGIMMGGANMAQRALLGFTRSQEQAADQAAVKMLEATGQSARGLLEFMEILGDQELLVASRQDPYVRTHPLTRDRVGFLQHHVDSSRLSDVAVPPEFAEMHRRLRAKLYGFLEAPGRTLQRYREDDKSLEARYARSIAYYRMPQLDKALPLIDGLLAERPRDPYFHELKGQVLFENGRGHEALGPYREAVRLLPGSELLRLSLAQVEIEVGDPALLKDAQDNLEFVVRVDRDSTFAWRLLAIAYGRAGNEAMASLAQGEEALLKRDVPAAVFHAGQAERLLKRGSPAWLQSQDIKERASQVKVEEKKKQK